MCQTDLHLLHAVGVEVEVIHPADTEVTEVVALMTLPCMGCYTMKQCAPGVLVYVPAKAAVTVVVVAVVAAVTLVQFVTLLMTTLGSHGHGNSNGAMESHSESASGSADASADDPEVSDSQSLSESYSYSYYSDSDMPTNESMPPLVQDELDNEPEPEPHNTAEQATPHSYPTVSPEPEPDPDSDSEASSSESETLILPGIENWWEREHFSMVGTERRFPRFPSDEEGCQ